MDGYGPATYGDGFADVYDQWYADLGDPDATAACVIELAGDGSVLELGVGTGRLAFPIAALGAHVVGVDTSTAMLEKFADRRSAQASAAPEVARADMSALCFAPASFSVVLAAYNVVFNLPAVELQERCVREVRNVLRDGGAFVVETFVPDDDGKARSGVEVREVTTSNVVLTASRLDPSDRSIRGQHIEISEAGVRLRPWFLHYLPLDELDRVVAAAGFRLESRWAGWRGEPFSGRAAAQIAVYRCV
jgi:SAM-dependent methyltransferase